MTDPAIQGMFDSLEASGAAMLRLIVRDDDDKPIRAVIFVVGEKETQDVTAALDQVEAGWAAS